MKKKNIEYKKGLGYYLGCFYEKDIAEGKDKKAVAEAQQRTGLGYTNQKIVMKNGVAVGIKIWVCDVNDFQALM